MFNTNEHYYLAQISLSNHSENKQVAMSNVLLVSPQAVSHDIQQAFVRNHIIQSLAQSFGNHPIITADLQVAENTVRYIKQGDHRSDDMIPFVEFKITCIPHNEYMVAKNDPCTTRTQVDLDFIHHMVAVKFVDGTVRVTAMFKPSFNIFKDGNVVDRIVSKHTIKGSVSSIVMGAGIKKVGLDDFAKLQSKIALVANQESTPTLESSNNVIWSMDDMMEELHGESARSYAV